MITQHLLRDCSIRTLEGYCLTCKDSVNIEKINGAYKCINAGSNSVIDKPMITPQKDKAATKLKSLTGKVDRLTRKYHMTFYEYLILLDTYDYACGICHKPFTTDNPAHIDHNHLCCPNKTSCGKCVRGLLCRTCNTGIGYFRDNPQYMSNGAEYLINSSK